MKRWIRIACAAALLGGCTSNTKRFQEIEGRVASHEAVAGQQARAMGVLEARVEQERARNEELTRLQNESQGRLQAHEEAIAGQRSEIDSYRTTMEDYREVRAQHSRLLQARLESVRRSIETLEQEADQLEGMISELESDRSPTYPREELPEDSRSGWLPREEPQPRP